jgi:hypothetical protein
LGTPGSLQPYIVPTRVDSDIARQLDPRYPTVGSKVASIVRKLGMQRGRRNEERLEAEAERAMPAPLDAYQHGSTH